jgi:hypothetical protein
VVVSGIGESEWGSEGGVTKVGAWRGGVGFQPWDADRAEGDEQSWCSWLRSTRSCEKSHLGEKRG